MCVADGDQCLSRRATGVRGGNQAFVHLADTGQVIVAEPASGDFGTQEGQGQAPGGDLAIRVVQGSSRRSLSRLSSIQPIRPMAWAFSRFISGAGSSMRAPESWLPAIITISSRGSRRWALTMKS